MPLQSKADDADRLDRLDRLEQLVNDDDQTGSEAQDDTLLSPVMRIDVLARPEQRMQREAIAAALFARPMRVGTIGRYRVLARVGEGGMGTVYAAYDDALDRKVAIKLVRASVAGNDAYERTMREAQALARISHPNVVQVFEIGEYDDQLFVAMEFLSGPTLRSWLDEAPRPWHEVLAVMRSAGEGLAAAHAQGIVHRDFKPQNLMFGADGRIRVLDFGLARASLELVANTDAEANTNANANANANALAGSLTMSGAMLGTPAYMAPERLRGRVADVRSDIHGFCVTLFEALHRRRPFQGETLMVLSEAIETGTIAPVPAGSRVPSWLHAVVVRGLDPDPAKRYASMPELLAALERNPARARRRSAIAAGLVMTGALAWAGLVSQAPPSAIDWRTQAEHLALQSAARLDAGEGVEALTLAIEAAALVEAHAARLEVVDTALFEASAAELAWGPIVDLPGFAAPLLFSPDSRRLALARELEGWASDYPVVEIHALDHDAPPLVLRDHGCIVGELAFTDDGALVQARCHETGAMQVWDATSGERIVRVAGDRSPVFSTAAARIAALEGADIELTDARSGQSIARLSGHPSAPTLVEFSPEGALLATGGPDQITRVWDAASGELVHTLVGSQAHALRFSADGSGRLVTLDGDGRLRVWTQGVGQPLAGEVSLARVHDLALAPDGRHVAVHVDRRVTIWALATRERVASFDDHAEDPLGREATALPARSLSFSPDGARLLVRRHDRRAELIVAETGRSLAKSDVWTFGAAFSPEGALLALGTASAVELVDTRTGARVATLPAGMTSTPAFSPDAGMLATNVEDEQGARHTRVWSSTPAPSSIVRVPGPIDAKLGVAITSDALVTVDDALARVWTRAGQPRFALAGHVGPITALAGSPTTIATGGVDATIRVWSPATGDSLATLEGHAGPIRALAYSPDATWLGSAGDDRFARVWALASGRELGEPLEHPEPVTRVAFGEAGTRLITTSGAFAFVWDPSTSRQIAQTPAHASEIEAFAIAASGDYFATHDDASIRVWDASSGALVHAWAESGERPMLAFSPEGRRLASASGVWDASSGTRLATLDELESGKLGRAFAFSPEGATLILGGHAFDATSGADFADFQAGHVQPVFSHGFLAGGERLVTVSADAMIVRELASPLASACARLEPFRVAHARVAAACEG